VQAVMNSVPDPADTIPAATPFSWQSRELYGNEDFYFSGINRKMPRDLLRALWIALHERVKVLVNYGTADYSSPMQLEFARPDEFWKPWSNGIRQGRLFVSDSHYGLMIGHCNVQTTVSLDNVIAVRMDKTPDFKVLWEAPRYVRPHFTLQDCQASGKTRFVLYDAKGQALKTGRTRRFAEQHTARFGGVLIDDTLSHREAQAALVGRRAVRLRNFDVDETS